jgi:hypothetical protein
VLAAFKPRVRVPVLVVHGKKCSWVGIGASYQEKKDGSKPSRESDVTALCSSKRVGALTRNSVSESVGSRFDSGAAHHLIP